MTGVRLRHVASINPATAEFDLAPDDTKVSFVPLEAVWPPRIDVSRTRSKAEVSQGYTRFRDGDVLVPKITPTFEADRSVIATGLLGGFGAGTTELHVIRCGDQIDRGYVNYLVSSRPFLSGGEAAMFGVAGQKRVPDSWLRNFRVPVPDVERQRAIADFLDTETARIDALITKKRRLIELMEERVNSRILQIVAGSGLVGESAIPSEPVRRLLRKHVRSTGRGEMVTAFRDGEVTTRAARGREGFTNAWTEGASFQRVEVGDVVIHGLDGFSGAIGDAQRAGVCSPVYHVCSPVEGDGAYYGRLLRLLALDGYLGNFAISTRERAVDFRNWDLFGRIPIPVAPVRTQCDIGEQIRAIRPLREKILASEVLAHEHRQALITAAVTGELDIPGAA